MADRTEAEIDALRCHRCDRPIVGIGAAGCSVLAELAAMCRGDGHRDAYRSAHDECARRGRELIAAAVPRG